MSTAGDAVAAALVALLGRDDVRAALREAVGAAAPDEWLDAEGVRVRYGLRMRTLVDAARRGELEIGRGGRDGAHGGIGHPIVRRSALERWIVEHEKHRAAARATARLAVQGKPNTALYDLAVARARRTSRATR